MQASQPGDLEVTRQLTRRWSEGGYEYASFETKITNQGFQPATDLKVADRNDDSMAYVTRRQSPLDYEDAPEPFGSWTLPREGLVPGASLTLQTVFRSTRKEPFLSVNAFGIVEAKVGGTVERYAAPATLSEGLSGGCGGCGDAVAFGRGGEGPAEATFDFIWAAAFLAAVGAGLVAVAFVARRRLRR